jgi:hypothetical protein
MANNCNSLQHQLPNDCAADAAAAAADADEAAAEMLLA